MERSGFHPYKLTSKPEKGKVPQASRPLTHEQLCNEKAASRSAADAQVSKRDLPTGVLQHLHQGMDFWAQGKGEISAA